MKPILNLLIKKVTLKHSEGDIFGMLELASQWEMTFF